MSIYKSFSFLSTDPEQCRVQISIALMSRLRLGLLNTFLRWMFPAWSLRRSLCFRLRYNMFRSDQCSSNAIVGLDMSL